MGRQVTTKIRKGMRYCKEKKELEWRKDAEEEDKEMEKKGEKADSFMARVCLPIMNDINQDLTFTAEVASDFPDEKLPTLDCTLWMEEGGILTHSFYEKPMKSQLLIEKDSAMENKQKFCINSNELTRRLYNVDEERVGEEEITRIIEHFTKQLKNSNGQGEMQGKR